MTALVAPVHVGLVAEGLRFAHDDDAEQIAGVYRRSFPLSVAHTASPAVVAALLDSRGTDFWTAELRTLNALVVHENGAGTVDAFVGWNAPGPSREGAEVVWLFVAPSAHDQGLGGVLHDLALHAQAVAGHSETRLWAVVGNPSGEPFYARRGWSPLRATRRVRTPAGSYPLRLWRRSLTRADIALQWLDNVDATV